MNLFYLALKLLRKDWRAGEWRVLFIALALAVGSLSTVGLFADRIHRALQAEVRNLIGADLRMTSTRAIPSAYREVARQHGVRTVASLTFPSMIASDRKMLLGEILAVESGYPLRGQIEIDDGTLHPAKTIPLPGTVWADERLLRRLEIKPGEAVTIGEKRFKVVARIARDIDQSIGFANFAPRALLNEADLAATGLMQEGSRVAYRLMFASEPEAVLRVRETLSPRLSPFEKMEDVREARPEIRTVLERAESFLGLAALTTAILAGVAMLLAAQQFVRRHLDMCAVMRCLGAQQSDVLRLFFYQLLLAGGASIAVGLSSGYLIQHSFVQFVEALRIANLPQPGLLPAFKAVASGLALLFGFAFLPFLQLKNVPSLRVLRRELGGVETRMTGVYALAALVLAGLFVWQAGSLKLGLVVLGGLLILLLCFSWVARNMLRGFLRVSRWRASAHLHVLPGRGRMCHALNNLTRPGSHAVFQIMALSLGGMALLLLMLVQGDLFASWENKFPVDAPNRFVVNIQPDQLDAVSHFLREAAVETPRLLPMIRGRLIGHNGRAVSGEDYEQPRAKALVEREFNLSYAAQMPDWNGTAEGKWWNDAAAGELSVETGLAETLGIRLGDTLRFDVAGTVIEARVTHLRNVQWDSMRVNFFVIASPATLESLPASYLTSFYLSPEQADADKRLLQTFSNLLVVDTGVIIAQVRGMVAQISQMVSLLFLFTLSAGCAVLYAALLATQGERAHEAAILRTLGADTRYLRGLYLSEWTVTGGLSGLFAASGAVLLGWALAHFVIHIEYHGSLRVWSIGILGGILVVIGGGWLVNRKLTRSPPLNLLLAD